MGYKQASKSGNSATPKLAIPWLPYAAPFALFMLFTELASFFPNLAAQFYIIKTIGVGSLLWFWRQKYSDDFAKQLSFGDVILAIFCGLIVLGVWVLPENYLFQLKNDNSFNPYELTDTLSGAIGIMFVRTFGAAIVVPIMEELFWRSFFMRYLINTRFKSVAMGQFTWFSFMSVAILFGLAHHRFIVGILAGIIYGLLLIYQRNLKGVMIAHGTTNLLLAIYVILSGNWQFW